MIPIHHNADASRFAIGETIDSIRDVGCFAFLTVVHCEYICFRSFLAFLADANPDL